MMLFNAFFISNKFSINKFCNCCVSNDGILKNGTQYYAVWTIDTFFEMVH